MRGANIEGGKAPQGELYESPAAESADTPVVGDVGAQAEEMAAEAETVGE
jgi:hypothetical protein